jgi:argininosuccinate synthase
MKLKDLNGKKLGVCVSGGLDSKTITRRLVDEGCDVVCFCADLGQPDEKDIRDVIKKMAPSGGKTYIVNLKDEMAKGCLETVRAQAVYDGGYWNSTGLARAITVRGLIPELKKHGCDVLVHGATGRGNDQMRFERYTNVLAPSMHVYAPWRDPELLKEFPGRKQMATYLKKRGVEATVGKRKRYSTDSNLAGLSYEAEDLESLTTPSTIVVPQMGVWPEDARSRPEKVSITFKKGLAVAINGKAMKPLKLMETANMIGGRNGIGIKNALENRIIGTKSRGVYEAPGMELLSSALLQVYYAVMDKRAYKLFNELSSLVGEQIYDGRLFDPATTAALKGIASLAAPATGTATLKLLKGNMYFMSLTDCKASLYNEEDSSMEASSGLNPESSQGFAEIQSVEAIALARAGQIRKNVL